MPFESYSPDGETEAEGGGSGHAIAIAASSSPSMQGWALAHTCAHGPGGVHEQVCKSGMAFESGPGQ